jgi:predicted PurR-regulated permease PerM
VLPIIIKSINDLVASIPTYINLILGYFDDVPEDSIWYSLNIADTLRESSSNYMNEYINLGRIEQVAREVIGLAGEVFSVLLGLIISLYIILELEKIRGFFFFFCIVLIRFDVV